MAQHSGDERSEAALSAAIERLDEHYLIEWIAMHVTSIEQARAGITRFFEAVDED